MATEVTIDGVTYPSRAAAGRALGMTRQGAAAKAAQQGAAPGGVGGRPVTPPAQLPKDRHGNVRPRVFVPESVVTAADIYAADVGHRDRVSIARGDVLGGWLAAGMGTKLAAEGWNVREALGRIVERCGGKKSAGELLKLSVPQIREILGET